MQDHEFITNLAHAEDDKQFAMHEDGTLIMSQGVYNMVTPNRWWTHFEESGRIIITQNDVRYRYEDIPEADFQRLLKTADRIINKENTTMKCYIRVNDHQCGHNGTTWITTSQEDLFIWVCRQHEKVANKGTIQKLWKPPVTSKEHIVMETYNQEEAIINKAILNDQVANSTMAQAYINKEAPTDQNEITDHEMDLGDDLPNIMRLEANMCSEKPKLTLHLSGSRSLKNADEKHKSHIVGEFDEYLDYLVEKWDLSLISGMSEGWDELGAMKAIEKSIPLTLVIPNVAIDKDGRPIPASGYIDYYYRRNSITGRNRLGHALSLIQRADNVLYTTLTMMDEGEDHVVRPTSLKVPVYDFATGTYSTTRTEHANFARNSHMVRLSEGGIVYNPTSRGTAHCVGIMRRIGMPFKVIG